MLSKAVTATSTRCQMLWPDNKASSTQSAACSEKLQVCTIDVGAQCMLLFKLGNKHMHAGIDASTFHTF